MQGDCRLSIGLPPSSWLCRLWSWKEDLQQAWNRDRRAVCDQVGLSHCQHDGLVTVRDKACLRRGHNEQSRQGHQCSETTLTEESRFHISTPLGIEPGSFMTGSKRVYCTTWPVELCMNAGRLQALHKLTFFSEQSYTFGKFINLTINILFRYCFRGE
jgi:hypothetical protein